MSFPIRTKKSIILIISCFILVGIIIGLSAMTPAETTAHPVIKNVPMVPVEDRYSTYLADHAGAEVDLDEEHLIRPADLKLEDGETLNTDGNYHWVNDTGVTFEVNIEHPGMYLIYINYQSLSDSVIPIELSVMLNGSGAAPYNEASQITLNTLWQSTGEPMGTDRYGNDVNVLQKTYDVWQNVSLQDASRLYEDGLKFYLDEGLNTIEIKKQEGQLLLGDITLKTRPVLAPYSEYLADHANVYPDFMKRYEAEAMFYKNASTISLGTSRDVGVLPFSLTKLKLNVLGTDSYNTAGEAVTWKVDVPQEGFYNVTFKVLQTQQNTTSYRTLYVDGKIPFAEARHLAFSYRSNWQNVTLQSLDHEPYLIYLKPGSEITLAVDSTLFTNIAEKLRVITGEMTELGLNITKLTRNNTDKGIDWEMLEYFPDLHTTLGGWITELTEINEALKALAGFDKNSQTIEDIDAAIAKLQKIDGNINELPRRLALLSVGSSCAVSLIANQVDVILKQPMIVDAFFVHSANQTLPKANGSFFEKLKVSISRFVMSFFDKSYSDKASDDEIEVWVNRSRQYVDLMQKISDDVFTKETGLKVKVSIMSDDGKLLLANSANRQPDVALGISAWIPNEYGMRGMLYDLSSEPDFRKVISVYHPEQLVPMIYDDKLYGLPETENFYVLFYRKDILDELGLGVPATWDDVLDMLPVLDRYGMSFYIPLSNTSSAKSFDTTAPFIYQFGGKFYSEDGLHAAVDDENTIKAMTFMTDLYREYNLTDQVPSFFNSFRYGRIPIGIADFGTYLQLVNAASEISGLWNIALVPGVRQDVTDPITEETTTTINRFMPGAQQAGIIFNKSDKKHEAWEYLSWWMSTNTQELFSETLVNTLGSRYMWNSANIEAFSKFGWRTDHKNVILEQWNCLREVPKLPGSYIVERELSNTWNSVVYNDANLRSTISDAILKMNKEISRKMKEFGYLDQEGNIVKPFRIPTADTVKVWGDGDE